MTACGSTNEAVAAGVHAVLVGMSVVEAVLPKSRWVRGTRWGLLLACAYYHARSVAVHWRRR